MIITCCKDCKNRYVGCHSKCKEYIEQKAEVNRISEMVKRDKELNRIPLYKLKKYSK